MPLGSGGRGNHGLSDATAVAVGESHSCALIAGGVWCWRYSGSGQLGNTSTSTSNPVPVPVQGLPSGVDSIAAAVSATCAVPGGAVWCWGENRRGTLGNNSTVNSSVPVQVQGLPAGVQAVSVGSGGHACALANGRAWCWGGDNRHGALGNGSTVDSLVPVEVVLP